MIPKVLCIGGPLDGEYSYSSVPPTVPAQNRAIPSSYVTYVEHTVTLPTGEFSRIFAPDDMTDRQISKSLKRRFR